MKGAVEIGYGILPPWEGKGYATEAVKAAMQWAYSNTGVYFVTAETDPGNTASQRVLAKLGFQPAGTGEEGPRFEAEKPAPGWTGLYMSMGCALGICFGVSTHNLGMTLPVGTALGLLLGITMDSQSKKTLSALKAERAGQGDR